MIDRFVQEARAHIGTPFVHHGRTAHGLDCLGLVLRCAAACGMAWPDRRYRIDPTGEGLSEELADLFGPPVDDMRPGDLLLIQWPRQPEPMHLAISAGDTMIHAMSGVGVCEHGIDDQWQRRIRGVYRWQ